METKNLMDFLKENEIYYVIENEKIIISNSLDLRGTKITALPENLTVGGGLNLKNTKISALPENLTVKCNLNLRGSKILTLPENLYVGGDIFQSI